MSFHFGTVYVREAAFAHVRRAIEEFMSESGRVQTLERGLEPTPDEVTQFKRIRSFAIMPDENGWIAVLEDGHPLDDGGLAEGLSELLNVETIRLSYSDSQGAWAFVRYIDGQPLEEGGSDGKDFDVGAIAFAEATGLPHFGVYYEEVADAAPAGAPALAAATFSGDIRPRVPMGTEIVTFMPPQ